MTSSTPTISSANAKGAPRPPFRFNQYGFTSGGPLTPSRHATFYFVSFEGGDRSLSSLDVAHHLVFNFQYQLPFGSGRRFLRETVERDCRRMESERHRYV